MYEDVQAQVSRQWLEAAETALKNNPTSFTIFDICELLRDDGLVAQLQDRGYVVDAP